MSDRRRLVVADDDAHLLSVLTDLLADVGYDVVGTAGDGLAAIEVTIRERPDLLLIDLRMPTMTGLEAADALSTIAPEIPIVMLSAYDDPGLQEAAHHARVAGYLVKGCSVRAIITAIESAIAAAAEGSPVGA